MHEPKYHCHALNRQKRPIDPSLESAHVHVLIGSALRLCPLSLLFIEDAPPSCIPTTVCLHRLPIPRFGGRVEHHVAVDGPGLHHRAPDVATQLIAYVRMFTHEPEDTPAPLRHATLTLGELVVVHGQAGTPKEQKDCNDPHEGSGSGPLLGVEAECNEAGYTQKQHQKPTPFDRLPVLLSPLLPGSLSRISPLTPGFGSALRLPLRPRDGFRLTRRLVVRWRRRCRLTVDMHIPVHIAELSCHAVDVAADVVVDVLPVEVVPRCPHEQEATANAFIKRELGGAAPLPAPTVVARLRRNTDRRHVVQGRPKAPSPRLYRPSAPHRAATPVGPEVVRAPPRPPR